MPSILIDFLESALIGLVISLVFSGGIYFIHTVFVAPFKMSKMKKNKTYHTVEAELGGNRTPYENNQGKYQASYEYTVAGKKYSQIITRDDYTHFDNMITLYYDKNPKRTVERIEELGRIENPGVMIKTFWFAFTLLVFIILKIAD